jgi:hypothetical protein
MHSAGSDPDHVFIVLDTWADVRPPGTIAVPLHRVEEQDVSATHQILAPFQKHPGDGLRSSVSLIIFDSAAHMWICHFQFTKKAVGVPAAAVLLHHLLKHCLRERSRLPQRG